VFPHRIAEVFHKECLVPIGHHGGVIVGPTNAVGHVGVFAVGAHDLPAMHPDSRFQSAIVSIHDGKGAARIMYVACLPLCRQAHSQKTEA